MKKYHYWTADDTAFLRANYATMPMADIINALNLSVGSIGQKARSLSLYRQRTKIISSISQMSIRANERMQAYIDGSEIICKQFGCAKRLFYTEQLYSEYCTAHQHRNDKVEETISTVAA